jgi:hypothetical protein
MDRTKTDLVEMTASSLHQIGGFGFGIKDYVTALKGNDRSFKDFIV